MTTDVHPKRRAVPRRIRVALGAIALLAIGGGAGAVVSHALKPAIEMAPLRPVTIASIPTMSGPITIRGKVTEIYGNQFVIQDASARTLVDTGREGAGATLVAHGATVTVQGRYDSGVVHASFLVDDAGKVTALRPFGGRHGGHRGHGGHGHHDGPREMPDADGPPPAPSAPPVQLSPTPPAKAASTATTLN